MNEWIDQQITDTQDGDETYLALKAQEAANISVPSKEQTSRNNNHNTHLHQNSHTVVYHHRGSLASPDQSPGQSRGHSRQGTSMNTNFTKDKSNIINDSHSNAYVPSRIDRDRRGTGTRTRTSITQAHPQPSPPSKPSTNPSSTSGR